MLCSTSTAHCSDFAEQFPNLSPRQQHSPIVSNNEIAAFTELARDKVHGLVVDNSLAGASLACSSKHKLCFLQGIFCFDDDFMGCFLSCHHERPALKRSEIAERQRNPVPEGRLSTAAVLVEPRTNNCKWKEIKEVVVKDE